MFKIITIFLGTIFFIISYSCANTVNYLVPLNAPTFTDNEFKFIHLLEMELGNYTVKITKDNIGRSYLFEFTSLKAKIFYDPEEKYLQLCFTNIPEEEILLDLQRLENIFQKYNIPFEIEKRDK